LCNSAVPNAASIDALEALYTRTNETPKILIIGQQAMDNGFYELAQKCFHKVTEASQNNFFASSWLALSQLALDPTSKQFAQRLAQAGILESSSFLSHLSFIIEKAWLASGAYFEEIKLPQTVQKKQGKPSFKRVSHWVEKNEWRRIYDELSQYSTNDDETVFSLALSCEMSGDFHQAKRYLDLLSLTVCDYPYVKATLARTLVRLRELPQAVTLMEQIIINGPEDFGMCYFWGIVMLAYQQNELAKDFFARAFTVHDVDTMYTIFPQIKRNVLNYCEK